MRVLVIEDEPDVQEFLVRVLHDASWAADGAPDGGTGLALLALNDYDLAVIDVGLPDIDGFDLCREIRKRGHRVPILLLTARNAVNDRVNGLDAGADDYLAKPFALSELKARLRALARRPPTAPGPVLRLADLELEAATRVARRNGVFIDLTKREFALLEYLLRNPRRVVTRAQILEHVWNDNFAPVANAVDVLVARLRGKIDRSPSAPLLYTVRGSGYMLTDERSQAGGDGA
jgi:DNA-binding response OmpR family regulator